ncbi:MAG: YqeG family HAD IIIA-type phosphatase [Oscillospiraceae bacterium]|nr:YqeG family HAD IIIA-type phosphatase [Oscillospiraceae bacterium]
MSKLLPKLYLDSVFHIDFETLKNQGITTLLFDLDNTIAAYEVPVADERVIEFFANLKEMGFFVCLVSNNRNERVLTYADSLDISYISFAKKPFKGGLLKACAIFGSKPNDCALIGDQVFTDVFGGNRLGMFTILVKPISPPAGFFIKQKRRLERMVLRRLKNNGQ